MIWIDISLKVNTADAEMAEYIAGNATDCGIYIEDYSNIEKDAMETAHIDLIEEELLKKDRQHIIIHVYAEKENPKEAITYLEEKYKAFGIEYEMFTSEIRQEDWANNWKKYFHQLKIGNKILICPSWEKSEKTDGREVLYLEPGMAFGTGTHATTSLCMEVMEKYITHDTEILDIGCGSGILALSALKLGACSALGVDIDENAVKTARENAVRNGYFPPRAEFIQGDLTTSVHSKFNLITANIVADVIIELLKNVRSFMDADTKLIVSGIIKEREENVRKAFLLHSLKIIEKNEKDGWVSFVLVKA